MDNVEKQKLNAALLDAYDISDINAPQVILRKVKEVDGDVLDDDLYCVRFNSDMEFQDIPDEFSWAKRDLQQFKKSYINMLNEPTERVHLEGIKESGCRILIEDRCSDTCGNAKSSGYRGLSVYNLHNRPAVYLVHDSFSDTTLLHEAIHNSDLRLGEEWFSSLTLHKAAMMMIDAQRIERNDSKQYMTTRQCREIDNLYRPGQRYIEGLTWITQISLTDLSKEKNHIGKNLKVLHSIYTEAVLNEQRAILDCFQNWQPSEHILNLLELYNKNGQMTGQIRAKIQKQEMTFWNELVKFRKGINKLKTRGLEYEELYWQDVYVYSHIGGNCVRLPRGGEKLSSHIPLYLAKGKARDVFESTPSICERVKLLQELFKDISAKDLNNDAVFADKAMVCMFYIHMLEESAAKPNEYELMNVKFSSNASSIEKRKQMYDILKKNVTSWGQTYTQQRVSSQNGLVFIKIHER